MKRMLSLGVIISIVTILSACGGADSDGNGGEPETQFFLDGTWDVEITITQSDTEEIGTTDTFEQEITATDTSVTLVGYGLDENDEPEDLVLPRSGNSVSYSEDEGAYTLTGTFTSATAFDGTITTTQTLGDEEFVTVRSIVMTKQP